MRRALEGPVRRWWQGEYRFAGVVAAPITLPLSLLYGAGVRVRNLLFDLDVRRAAQAPLPVVSVGNLTVGGTGKTPVSRWVVEELEAMGRRPAVVLRGYGRDEVELHRRWGPGRPVVRDPDRVAGARKAAEEGADVLVLDDGFQHRRLARDLDIVLVAVEDPFPARLLPRGPWRERPGALRRAGLVFVTFRSADDAGRAGELARRLGRRRGFPPALPLRLGARGWTTLAGGEGDPPPPGAELCVVASVARPASVLALAEASGNSVGDLLAFPDHHEYTERDVRRIAEVAGGRPIVTTEKDAVKLEPLAGGLGPVHVLAFGPQPDPAVARILGRELERLLREGGR